MWAHVIGKDGIFIVALDCPYIMLFQDRHGIFQCKWGQRIADIAKMDDALSPKILEHKDRIIEEVVPAVAVRNEPDGSR